MTQKKKKKKKKIKNMKSAINKYKIVINKILWCQIYTVAFQEEREQGGDIFFSSPFTGQKPGNRCCETTLPLV